MLERVVRQLQCPGCGGHLDVETPRRKVGGRLRYAGLTCRRCQASYGIRECVGLLGAPLPQESDWRVDPGLATHPPDEELWQRYLASLPPEVPAAYEEILERLEREFAGMTGLVGDLATCHGHVLRRIAPRVGGHQLLLGLEPEASRLYPAQVALRRERRYSQVSLAEVDPVHWPLPDRSLGGLLSFYGPSLLPRGRGVLREAARCLRPRATFAFGTLLTREGSLSVRQARTRRLEELLTEERLRKGLSSAGFLVDAWEVLAQGTSWPRNAYDPLPCPGDPFFHVYVRAIRRPEGSG